MADWFVYMVRCSDQSLYTGIARDIGRRLNEHNGDLAGGAKYTRARRPVELVYTEQLESRSQACQREHQIRQLGKKNKEALIVEKIL